MIKRRKSRKIHCWRQSFLEINTQTCDLTLVVQTEKIVSFLCNKIKFCSAVLIFGSGAMVAVFIALIAATLQSNSNSRLSQWLCLIWASGKMSDWAVVDVDYCKTLKCSRTSARYF